MKSNKLINEQKIENVLDNSLYRAQLTKLHKAVELSTNENGTVLERNHNMSGHVVSAYKLELYIW